MVRISKPARIWSNAEEGQLWGNRTIQENRSQPRARLWQLDKRLPTWEPLGRRQMVQRLPRKVSVAVQARDSAVVVEEARLTLTPQQRQQRQQMRMVRIRPMLAQQSDSVVAVAAD